MTMSSRAWWFLFAATALSACATAPAPAPIEADRLWFVRAVAPDGRFLAIAAVDQTGALLDLTAIETPRNAHVLDVKVIKDGARWPVKVTFADGAETPVQCIAPDGTRLDVKAIAADGRRFDVRALTRAGNLLQIKALGPDGGIYGVKAISPDGHLMDVKGMKFGSERVEGTYSGVPVLAHVKAVPQVTEYATVERLWHVLAIDPHGWSLPVMAAARNGSLIPIEAIETPGNQHVMDVKALLGDERLPVKLMFGDAEHAPVQVIASDASVLDVQAIAADGRRFPVIGLLGAGNLSGIKAIGPNGAIYAVKAVSPEGFLHDVKGVKVLGERVEGTVSSVSFHAHVKALPQATLDSH